MGDRAHVVIDRTDALDDNPPVYIYVHNAGTVLPELTAAALDRARGDPTEHNRHGRLRSPSYTTRAVVDELTAWEVVTGYNHELDDYNSAHMRGVGISSTYLDRSDGRREVRLLWDDAREVPPTVTLINYEYATHEYDVEDFITEYAAESPYARLMDDAGYTDDTTMDEFRKRFRLEATHE